MLGGGRVRVQYVLEIFRYLGVSIISVCERKNEGQGHGAR